MSEADRDGETGVAAAAAVSCCGSGRRSNQGDSEEDPEFQKQEMARETEDCVPGLHGEPYLLLLRQWLGQ